MMSEYIYREGAFCHLRKNFLRLGIRFANRQFFEMHWLHFVFIEDPVEIEIEQTRIENQIDIRKLETFIRQHHDVRQAIQIVMFVSIEITNQFSGQATTRDLHQCICLVGRSRRCIYETGQNHNYEREKTH